MSRSTMVRLGAYGSLELGVSAIESFLRLFLLIFYTDRVGVDPKLAGFVIALGVLWDAIMDPLVGRLCDRTRSPFGSRLPWIFLGAPVLGLSVALMFSVPPGLSSTMQVLWLLVSNVMVNTSMAAVSIPHLAMGSDLTDSGDERTSMYAWRMMMSVAGLFVGLAVPALLSALEENPLAKDLQSSRLLGLLVASMGWGFSLFFLKEVQARLRADTQRNRASSSSPEASALGAPSKRSVVEFIKTPAVIALLVGYGIATFGQGVNSSLALYYYKYFLKLADQDLQLVLLIFMALLVASLPLWVISSKRIAKERLLALGTVSLGVLTSISYPFIPAGNLAFSLSVTMAVLGGISLGTVALFESHLTDLAEHFSLDQDSMGSVFGIWKFLAKAARALAIAITGALLSWVGYTADVAANGIVAPEVAWRIALGFGPGVGVFFIAGGALLLRGGVRRRDSLLPSG